MITNKSFSRLVTFYLILYHIASHNNKCLSFVASSTNQTSDIIHFIASFNQCFIKMDFQVHKESTFLLDSVIVSIIYDVITSNNKVSFSVVVVTNRTNLGKETWKHGALQYSKCFAQFLFPSFGVKDLSFGWVAATFLTQKDTISIPHCVVIWHDQDVTGKLEKLKSMIIELTYQKSHLFYIVTNNRTQVYALCPHCTSQITQKINLTLNFEDELHYQRGTINMYKEDVGAADLSHDEINTKIRTCNKIPQLYNIERRPPTVELCTIDELSQKYNFTYLPVGAKLTHGWRRHFLYIIRRQTMTQDYLINIMYKNDRQVVETGLIMDHWAFMVVKKKQNFHQTALSNPFKFPFILIFFLALGTIALLSVFTLKLQNDKISFESVTKSLTALVGTCLDQSVSGTGGKYKNILWIIWLFSILLVSNIFRGKMFLSLTTTTHFNYSESLPELVKSSIMVATFELAKPATRGNVRSEVLTHLADALKDDSFKYPTYYLELHNSIKFFPVWLTGMGLLTRDLFLQEHKAVLSTQSNPDNIMPEEFAVLDLKKHVEMQRDLLSLYLPRKWLSPVISVNMVTSCMPWTVTTNYFYEIFKRGLGLLFESGLYTRWDRFHDDINGLKNFYDVNNLLGLEDMKTSGEINFQVNMDNWHNFYFYLKQENHKACDNCVLENGRNDGLGLTELSIVWIFFIKSLAFTMICFLIEYTYIQVSMQLLITYMLKQWCCRL